MKKLFFVGAIVFSTFASSFSAAPGAECPDRCVTAVPPVVCCTTPGGSTYNGVLNNPKVEVENDGPVVVDAGGVR